MNASNLKKLKINARIKCSIVNLQAVICKKEKNVLYSF